MGELEDRINRVLGDPSQMEQITQLARSLMGGDSAGETPPQENADPFPDFDPALIGKISRLMRSDAGKGSDKRALLEAMKPYMSEKRRQKMDKALKIARIAKLAQMAMGESGGGDDG